MTEDDAWALLAPMGVRRMPRPAPEPGESAEEYDARLCRLLATWRAYEEERLDATHMAT